jgi:hypothetical protein
MTGAEAFANLHERLGGSGSNPDTSHVDINAALTFLEDAPPAPHANADPEDLPRVGIRLSDRRPPSRRRVLDLVPQSDA